MLPFNYKSCSCILKYTNISEKLDFKTWFVCFLASTMELSLLPPRKGYIGCFFFNPSILEQGRSYSEHGLNLISSL